MKKKLFLTFVLVYFLSNSYAQLNGTVTVGNNAADYLTIKEACVDIEAQGLSGPLVVNIQDGNYLDDSLYLSKNINTSKVNTLTFKSENNDSALVKIKGLAPVFLTDTFTKYITIQDLTIITDTLAAISITEGASNINLNRLHIIGDTSIINAQFRSEFSTINITSGDSVNKKADHIIISNSFIENGYTGIYYDGDDGQDNDGLVYGDIRIINNNISNFFRYGIYTYGTNKLTIKNNIVNREALSTISRNTALTIDASSDTSIVDGNKFYIATENATGIDIEYNLKTQYITNNFISVYGSGSTGFECDYLINDIKIINNTFVSDEDCIDGYFDVKTTMYNNIFYSINGGYIFNLSYNVSTFIPELNNNAYYTSGEFAYVDWPFYFSADSLEDWQTKSKMDSKSFTLFDPKFKDAYKNLHACSDSLIGTGKYFDFVKTDIDGEARTINNPSIGADIFQIMNSNFLGDSLSFCEGTSVTIDAGIGTDYLWSNSQQSRTIEVITPGIYSVELNGDCYNNLKDTVYVYYDTLNPSFTYDRSYLTVVFTNSTINTASYLWDFGDGNTSTEKNPVHIYDLNDEYEVSLTVENDCDTYTKMETISVNVGMNEKNSFEFNLSPNPTNGIVNLYYELSFKNNDILNVFDLQGRIISSEKMNKNHTVININDQPNGIYIIQIVNEKGISNQRIIKF